MILGQALRSALVVAGIAGVTGLLSTLLRTSKPFAGDTAQGVIMPDRITAWITIIIGVAMTIGGIALFIDGERWLVLSSLVGAPMAFFMAPSVTAIHAVRWDAEGIDGPSKLFGLTLGRARTSISWPEIAKTGTTSTGYWFVQALDGRKIYWSFAYKGYGVLTAALKLRRPELPLVMEGR